MKGVMPKIGAVGLALALLASFWLDFANMAQGGAIDLRNRITGLRLLEAGIDPYHYKWHEGDPDIYCDVYNNPDLPVSKTTASPALLMLNAPLAPLPYRLAQLLWLLGQWALLLGTGGLWLRAAGEPWQRWMIAIFMTGFTYTAAWRLHAERGQSYIVLTFLLACWLALSLDPARRREFLAGAIAGLLGALRPSFLILVPFILLHRSGQRAGAVLGLLLGLGWPILIDPGAWSFYAGGMEDNSAIYRSGIDVPFPPQSFPPRIEGIPTDILAKCVAIPYADSSLFRLLLNRGWDHFPALPIVLIVVAPFGVWLWLSRKASMGYLLCGTTAWYFLFDFALPAYRNTYNDVLILDFVGAGLVTATRVPGAIWPCALALPAGWAVYAFSPEAAGLINGPTLLCALSAALFLFNIRAGSSKVEAAC